MSMVYDNGNENDVKKRLQYQNRGNTSLQIEMKAKKSTHTEKNVSAFCLVFG